MPWTVTRSKRETHTTHRVNWREFRCAREERSTDAPSPGNILTRIMKSKRSVSDRTAAEITAKPFRFYFKKHARSFGAGVLALFFTNLLDTLTPLALMSAIDMIKVRDLSGLGGAIGVYSALMVGVTVFRYLWRIYFGRFHQAVADDLRNRIFAKFTLLGPSFYQRNPVGQLMSLLTNDVNSFRMAIGPGTLILLDAIFLVMMILPLMLYLSVDWTWKTMILLPLVPFFIRRIEALIHKLYRAQQDRLSEVSAAAQEIISGVRVIKGFAQEENKRAAFNRLSHDYERACNLVARVDAFFEPVMEFAVASGGVVLLYYCASDVSRAAMSLGAFVAFHEYIRKMVWPMSAIGMGISMCEQGRASFDRIGELLRTVPDVPDEGQIELRDFEKLEIRDLTFRYPGCDTPALEAINLAFSAGETIGIVGPLGAGKTTLLQLLVRLFPVETQRIFVNGYPLENIKLDSLRNMISFVPQDAFLFSDTIADNVALGLEHFPGVDPVREVTRAVNIDQEIESIPGGFDAYLGERGVNLSGGQKQRLTIARALIRRSPLVILDDSLSAVDGNTEKTIVHALKEALSSRHSRRQTTLIVSHRLATLKHADRIIVLNNGRIEAIGAHAELLATSATYGKLHVLQTEQRFEANAVPI